MRPVSFFISVWSQTWKVPYVLFVPEPSWIVLSLFACVAFPIAIEKLPFTFAAVPIATPYGLAIFVHLPIATEE